MLRILLSATYFAPVCKNSAQLVQKHSHKHTAPALPCRQPPHSKLESPDASRSVPCTIIISPFTGCTHDAHSTNSNQVHDALCAGIGLACYKYGARRLWRACTSGFRTPVGSRSRVSPTY